MQIFITSHDEKMCIMIIMPVRVDKISVDFDPYTETVNAVTIEVLSL